MRKVHGPWTFFHRRWNLFHGLWNIGKSMPFCDVSAVSANNYRPLQTSILPAFGFLLCINSKTYEKKYVTLQPNCFV